MATTKRASKTSGAKSKAAVPSKGRAPAAKKPAAKAAKKPAAKATKKPAAAKKSAPKPAKSKGVSAPGVASGLAIACAVFDALGWTYKVAEGPEDTAEIFLNARGTQTFAGVKAIHYPGRLVLFGVASFNIPESQVDEAYRFVSHVNNALQDGCLMVRTPAPAEITFRTAVNYTRLDALHPNLVTAAIADLIEGATAVFPGLEAVAEGASADDAFDALA